MASFTDIPEKTLLKFVRRELPHFEPQRELSQDCFSRLSINRDDAIALLEAHQQTPVILEETQMVFKK